MSFEIISFEAAEKRYYPASVELGSLDDGNYLPHHALDLPLGHSRYGGPIIDLPPGLEHPAALRFAAQIDLSTIAPHDRSGLLPPRGQLLFFCDPVADTGRVIYADVDNHQLHRIIVEHEDSFWDGVLIQSVRADKESWSERYREPEDEEEGRELAHLLNADGKLWDEFGGSARSKMLGMVTHCQWDEEEVRAKMADNQIVLVQFGENGFNDEGVFFVLIDREDLRNCHFDACEFYWSQS